MNDTSKPKSLVWLVGVDFSLLLVGIAVVFAAIRLRPGDDKSRVDDIAQASIKSNLGSCFQWKWSVDTGGKCTIPVQVPDPNKDAGWETACMPLVLVIQDANRASPVLSVQFRVIETCKTTVGDQQRLETFLTEFKKERTGWPRVISFDSFAEDYRELIRALKTNDTNWDCGSLEKTIPFLSHASTGLDSKLEAMKYAVEHIEQRLAEYSNSNLPSNTEPDGFRPPEEIYKLATSIGKFLKNPKNHPNSNRTALPQRFLNVIGGDQSQAQEPLCALLALEIQVIIEMPKEIKFTVEVRSAGDCQGHGDKPDDPANYQTVEVRGIDFIKFNQSYTSSQPIIGLRFNKRKPTVIDWKNKKFTEMNP